jgi:hypothetical protein
LRLGSELPTAFRTLRKSISLSRSARLLTGGSAAIRRSERGAGSAALLWP